MNNLTGLCVLCKNPAVGNCMLCGARVCSAHFDSNTQTCSSCRVGKMVK